MIRHFCSFNLCLLEDATKNYFRRAAEEVIMKAYVSDKTSGALQWIMKLVVDILDFGADFCVCG